ncbi:MAG: hypothetical protein A2857_00675 [Candidatus Levybacteria bacterium RIFCSPHIGHO2_01_FULL_36_15]|nr:MAG: hypothetical protein A2857_00675 [Candidatus Levybacteria bacterium RIFCSPHIGHO2_01_FULL_36_15]OGH39237.1 MAG: hypothetical protein A2905_01660 [Candidatus Levybacteria bacterium RIFCSPLOWO2_01_FULL_36_10]
MVYNNIVLAAAWSILANIIYFNRNKNLALETLRLLKNSLYTFLLISLSVFLLRWVFGICTLMSYRIVQVPLYLPILLSISIDGISNYIISRSKNRLPEKLKENFTIANRYHTIAFITIWLVMAIAILIYFAIYTRTIDILKVNLLTI